MIDLNKMDKEAFLLKKEVHNVFDGNHMVNLESYYINSFAYREKLVGGGEFHGSEVSCRKYFTKVDTFDGEIYE